MKKRSMREEVVQNSFWSFLYSLINRIGALVFTIILARFLMPERYGLYSIVLSAAMIFFTLSELGTTSAVIRYVSYALARDKKRVYSYYKYLLKIKLMLTMVFSLIFAVSAYPLAYYLFRNSELFLPFLAAAFYVFAISIDAFYTSFFYTVEKTKYLSVKEAISQIFRISAALLVFYFVLSSYYVLGLFVALTLTTIAILAIMLFYLRKLIPEIFIKPKENLKIDKKRVLKYIGISTIASISAIFFSYIDSLMLGFFVKPEYVGFYRSAFSLIAGVIPFISAPLMLFLPILTRLKKNKTSRFLNQALKYLIIFAVPASVGLIMVGKYFIMLFYGQSYLPAALPLYFLSLIIVPSIYVGTLLALFSAKEKPEIFAKLIFITSLLNIVLNFIFIKSFLLISPIWGTAGAAIATLISWLFYWFAVILASRKEFKISISLKILIKPIIASLAMALVLYFSMKNIPDMNVLYGILEISLGVAVYFAVLFLLKGIKKEDLDLIKILINKRK